MTKSGLRPQQAVQEVRQSGKGSGQEKCSSGASRVCEVAARDDHGNAMASRDGALFFHCGDAPRAGVGAVEAVRGGVNKPSAGPQLESLGVEFGLVARITPEEWKKLSEPIRGDAPRTNVRNELMASERYWEAP